MATPRKRKKSSRIGAKGRTSHSREIQKLASGTLALIGAVSPWLIYWISGGK